jgi:predicted GTPase
VRKELRGKRGGDATKIFLLKQACSRETIRTIARIRKDYLILDTGESAEELLSSNQLAEFAASTSDAILLVFSCEEVTEEGFGKLTALAELLSQKTGVTVIPVANKSDLLKAEKRKGGLLNFIRLREEARVVKTNAMTREGFPELLNAIESSKAE